MTILILLNLILRKAETKLKKVETDVTKHVHTHTHKIFRFFFNGADTYFSDFMVF